MLVHYRDLRSAQPEQDQWEDRLWVFEPAAGELRFHEYPAVRFDDESGRYERGGERQRTLGAWEPSESQRREIAAGLEADAYGAREKRLRPTATGFSSAKNRFDSARLVSFESQVDLDLSGAAPRITVSDSLGSSAAQALEGRTEYRGERLEPDGSVSGHFDRDGRRIGSFRMVRSGVPRGLGAPTPRAPDEPTRAEVEARLFRTLGRELANSEVLPERAGDTAPDARAHLLARIRAEVERLFADQGNDPRVHAPMLARLSDAIERAYTDEGRSRQEIGRLVEEGKLRP